MGLDKCTEFVASTTHFPILDISRHYIPISISEYENDKLNFDWDTLLKNNYDRSPGHRGTAQQTVNLYPSNCMFVID